MAEPFTDERARDSPPTQEATISVSRAPLRRALSPTRKVKGTTMNSMMLVLALSAGQGPAGGSPLPPGYIPLNDPRTVATVPALQAPAVQPAPAPAPAASQPAPAAQANGNGNGNGCDPCKEEEKPEDEPWALMRVLKGTCFGCKLDKCGITISGWTEGSYTLGNRGPNNLPVTFNDRGDFWQMNQNFLRIDKSVDPKKKEFQIGGRTEWILPGTDARFTPSRNLLDNQTGDYRIDLLQAYVETFHPNLGPEGTTVRWGKFATHCEYELMQGAETPFLSRSYLFQYNPFTHSGVWAITPLNDTWTMSHGFVIGSDNFFGAPSRGTYLGQLKWAPPEGKNSVLLNAVVMDPTFDVGDNFAFYNVYNMQVTHKFNDKLTGVLDAAASHMDGIPNVAGAAWWYGAAAYALYKFNDQWGFNLRNELFEDDKGVRTGFAGLYYEVCANVVWSPKRWLIFRPGIRWDYNADSRPWEGKRDLFTACFDAIVRW
jgi:hypothetical protein